MWTGCGRAAIGIDRPLDVALDGLRYRVRILAAHNEPDGCQLVPGQPAEVQVAIDAVPKVASSETGRESTPAAR